MKKERVLVITGGHGPGLDGARAIAEALVGDGMKVSQAEESSAIKRLDSGSYDCVVLTPNSHITEADVLSLEDFVRGGGGLVAVGAPGSVKGRDMIAGLLGCRVTEHSQPFDFKVGVTDASHPIVHRLGEFLIHDEMSVLEKGADAHAVLASWWGGRGVPMLLVRSEGKGRVAVLANGRTAQALAHPTWRRLLSRSARWSAGEDWSKKTVKVGIVGYGGAFNMGKLHAEACARARLLPVAVCDLDPKRVAIAKGELGDHVRTFSDLGRMLAETDVELCVIVTPHNTHAPLSIQCLEAGRHVVTEKPYTITVAEATKVIETAKRVGRMATVFHNRRWDGDFLAMKRIVESGAIGDPFHIECFFGGFGEPRPDWWRSYKEHSGGAFYDWGAHFADWVLSLMPHRIESVSGSVHKRVWHQVSNEDHIEAFVRFVGGSTASIQQSSIAAIPKSRFRILGTRGGIEQRTAEPNDGLRVVSFRDGQRTESTQPCLASDWDAFWRNVADHLIL
ncbi:MAG: Gfo/Idh/MocA family oxidoreductase, partial [Planctomycetes bacterium]|nr:Gfo/Idh/MocA family oxidoreductase [Planctomycetota bacterium]